ncbi:hypothetical protein [Zunongwangia profunda]|uniref:hypothetical protein n=1 Tax=Zunongwangia profunda TaxID=398743 RepID=UPI000C8A5882|nr:hypothetical protein [Zunongwangia profunda]MAG87347.1 hypothetical protein [Flavobacteriaceae bacterium]|tara:strand:+ start:10557 stop:10982 length:426 start_codon:yes stop_codon:yes gene_type:complete
MENYILQFLKNGIEELRDERWHENKNPLAKGLIAFIDAEMSKNRLKDDLVHYQLYAGDINWELWEGQNPRGIRHEDKRPELIRISTNKVFNRIELEKHIKYLGELINALEANEPCNHQRKTRHFSDVFGVYDTCLYCGKEL